jgi:phospholipid/cholesterol/gamma-HCH transport system ATP-binding protein
MNDALIEIRGLRFAYGERPVLDAIDLDIPRGKVTAILGGSGCGKTTLLRLIGGQARPAAGHVKVDGQTVHELGNNDLYKLRRKIGRMFQESGLFTDLSVYENIAFPMREHTDLPEDMIHDLALMKLHSVGLRGAHGLMPGELSGGMARRVALARAIALDPMLAIYDEPFSGLDPISLNVIASLIRRLNDALGITSIVVTYDVSESLKIADYAYFIDAGKVVAGGPVAEVLAARNAFVDQFVHALPDGPVAFDYPAPALATDLEIAPRPDVAEARA